MVLRLVMKLTLIGLLLVGLSGCIERDEIARVADAENIHVTTDGRLFVTGGKNLYEIHPDGNGYSATPLYDGDCYFRGLTQKDQWLFTTCQSGIWWWKSNRILAADLSSGPNPAVVELNNADGETFNKLHQPHSLVFAPSGKLLVSDYDAVRDRGIARLTVDFSGTRPAITSVTPDALFSDFGIHSPNELKVDGRYLYVADGNKVRRIRYRKDGSLRTYILDYQQNPVPNRRVVFEGDLATVVDGLQPWCGGVILTQSNSGQISYVSATFNDQSGLYDFNTEYTSPAFGFDHPSGVAIGQTPLFNGKDLLVAEKGWVRDFYTSHGNQLSRVRLDFNLNDPATCSVIQDTLAKR
ncbi:hypothetical protein QQM79_03325 [Marinobacteraceae bacterium S3BR75-40.1]